MNLMAFEHFGNILDAFNLPYSTYKVIIAQSINVAKKKQEEYQKLQREASKYNTSNNTNTQQQMPIKRQIPISNMFKK